MANKNQDQDLLFWEEYLKGVDQLVELPFMQKNNPAFYELNESILNLDIETSNKIRKIANNNQVTVNTFFQAVWSILLKRYTGADDIVFGAVTSGRPTDLKGAQDIVGLFINTIPVRIKVDETISFPQFLAEIQQKNALLKSN